MEKAILKRTYQQMETTEELQNALEIHNYAEEVGNFCSYRFNLQTRQYIFSDNLYRIMGCKPETFSTSAEFQSFVHPDDFKIVLASGEAVFNHTFSSCEYRIIRKDHTIVHLLARGKKIIDKQNAEFVIGALQVIKTEKGKLCMR